MSMDNEQHRKTVALQKLMRDPAAVLALIAENDRLSANVKLNLCDYPAIHEGDVDLLIAFVTGTSQMELAKVHGCTPPNISRKIRRVKQRLGWREGMSLVEIRARAEQLRALASQGAIVTADLMAERDQLKAENEALRKYGEEFAVLAERRREEVETLRKERDARHPFKPFHEPAIGFTGCVICGVYTDHGGLPCPKTRATADAAMGNGEQS
ncbi:hypothetical protein [Pseudomonas sp. G5001]|uniref:hypothetical protein n=1 Tax=Pseudomonas sp. G5001 TaxID=2738824 RepID=UPI00210BA93E|nr:hypothetical protein [Pseudomonas sp. G5001]